MSEKIEDRPFEETIMDAISYMHHPNAIEILLYLLRNTQILSNYDKIIGIWNSQMKILGLEEVPESKVVAEILAKKKREGEEMAKRDEAMLQEQIRREERLMREDALER